MNKIKILIVEDDAVQSLKMARDLTNFNYQIVGQAKSVDKALALIAQKSPNLVLLDINLTGQAGDRGGIELGKIIREKYRLPFIYITALEDDFTFQQAIRSTHPQNYIVKPYHEKDLFRAIEIAMDTFIQISEPLHEEDFIVVKESNYELNKILLKDILFIESDAELKKIFSISSNKYSVIRATMEELEEKLKGNFFIRIHRSYIINLDYASRYKGSKITIGSKTIPVGDTYKESLHNKLQDRGLF